MALKELADTSIYLTQKPYLSSWIKDLRKPIVNTVNIYISYWSYENWVRGKPKPFV